MKAILTPDADKHIKSIRPYSEERFGAKRTQKYLKDLFARLDYLAQRPQAGRPIKLNGLDYLKYPQESHVIYYRPIGEDILVIGVLGKSQDPRRHLS